MILFTITGLVSVGEGSRIYLKALLAQVLLQTAWSETLDGRHKVKPWPWADFYPVAKLTVPSLKVSTIVLGDANGRTLWFGPGYMRESTPLGQHGNSVLVGHRDSHFRFLRDVNLNTRMILTTLDGHHHHYVVTASEVVHESATHVLNSTDIKQLTLITCWPFDAIVPGGPLRYVVHADVSRDPHFPKTSSRIPQGHYEKS